MTTSVELTPREKKAQEKQAQIEEKNELRKAAFLKKDLASISPLNKGGSDQAYVKGQY